MDETPLHKFVLQQQTPMPNITAQPFPEDGQVDAL
jgi:hypothetical protein